MLNTVFVPGYQNSFNGHWQEIWCNQFNDSSESENSYWVEQNDWQNPHCVDWVEALNSLVQSLEGPVLFVTHSLGGSTVVEWSNKYTANIVGAFIVAVPDVHDANLPKAISGYQALPLTTLPFPSIVLASTDDPYCKIDRAAYFAEAWGSQFVNMGDLGHINVESNINEWPEGKTLLNQFMVF